MPQTKPRDDDERLRLHLLVLRCQAGDERAFERLFSEFQMRTLGYLQGIVGDAAEDLQQEVWLSVYRNISRLANPGAFRTWLFRSTRHRAVDYLRSRKREQELIADVSVEELDGPGSTDDDTPADEWDIERFTSDLGRLTAPHREVLLLRYQDDLSYTEIAMIIGRSVGTVRSRLHYAKRYLEERITKRETGDLP